MHHVVAIIDDSKTDLFIVEKVIKACQSAKQVISFSSAIVALAMLRLTSSKDTLEAFPTIIFLDVHMPGMGGFEFLEHFSRFPEDIRKHCSVVMLSSNASVNEENLKPYPFVRGCVRKPLSDETVKAYLQ